MLVALECAKAEKAVRAAAKRPLTLLHIYTSLLLMKARKTRAVGASIFQHAIATIKCYFHTVSIRDMLGKNMGA